MLTRNPSVADCREYRDLIDLQATSVTAPGVHPVLIVSLPKVLKVLSRIGHKH